MKRQEIEALRNSILSNYDLEDKNDLYFDDVENAMNDLESELITIDEFEEILEEVYNDAIAVQNKRETIFIKDKNNTDNYISYTVEDESTATYEVLEMTFSKAVELFKEHRTSMNTDIDSCDEFEIDCSCKNGMLIENEVVRGVN